MSIFDPAEQVVEPLEEDFAIRVGHHTIHWESWPQCVAATRAGTRCLQPATSDNPGPHRNGAYLVEIRETYGSREAEVLRRLVTQRCHLHDNATPAAIEKRRGGWPASAGCIPRCWRQSRGGAARRVPGRFGDSVRGCSARHIRSRSRVRRSSRTERRPHSVTVVWPHSGTGMVTYDVAPSGSSGRRGWAST
jgi:hypothetical protein